MDLLLVIFFISLLILGTGAFVKPLENLFITEPVLALCLGILLSENILGVIPAGPDAETHSILLMACKFTMAMALMATALRIPSPFFRHHYQSQSVLILGGMFLMWIVSSFVFKLFLTDFSFVECLLLGAIISPTDPVIASTIITGKKAEKYLPESVRHTLSFESGTNDGLAFPLVIFSIFLYNRSSFPIEEWLTKTVLYETLLCAFIAYIIGYYAGKGMHQAHKKGYMTGKTLLSYSLGLAFLLLTGLEVIQMNGILGVFVGGVAFNSQISNNEDLMEERVQESMERLFTIPIFFLFGLIVPWGEWYSLGWTAIWICLGVLMFRRIPALLLLMPAMPQFKGKIYDILIMGWYGPIGVAALFYTLHAKEKTGLESIWVYVSLIIFASTVVHGITSTPFERIYSKITGFKRE